SRVVGEASRALRHPTCRCRGAAAGRHVPARRCARPGRTRCVDLSRACAIEPERDNFAELICSAPASYREMTPKQYETLERVIDRRTFVGHGSLGLGAMALATLMRGSASGARVAASNASSLLAGSRGVI